MIFLSALAMFPCSVTWRRFSSSTGAELKFNPCPTTPPILGITQTSSTLLIHFRCILGKSELKQSWNSSLYCHWSRFTAWDNSWGLQSSNPGMNPAQEPDDATGCKSPWLWLHNIYCPGQWSKERCHMSLGAFCLMACLTGMGTQILTAFI